MDVKLAFFQREHLTTCLRRRFRCISPASGFTLFELIITLTVLAVLIMGTIPLAQNSVKRQRESRLRESLRMMRLAIDEFKRDTVGACPAGSITTANPTVPGGRFPGGQNLPVDPRSRVVVDDCTIFDSENLDRYPPSLDTLVSGVTIKQRGLNAIAGAGLGKDDRQATELDDATSVQKKVYLRELPIDPMTGKSDWQLRSSYQTDDAGSWDGVNVFDVRSSSNEEALNGEKYSDW
jgi:general secretion pathway protein G